MDTHTCIYGGKSEIYGEEKMKYMDIFYLQKKLLVKTNSL